MATGKQEPRGLRLRLRREEMWRPAEAGFWPGAPKLGALRIGGCASNRRRKRLSCRGDSGLGPHRSEISTAGWVARSAPPGESR